MKPSRILVTKHLFWIVFSMISFFFVAYATAQDKVVVIPLLGEQATGNATQADVLNGKTFSNSTATGLTGTRPEAPVQKTGQTNSYRAGDDGFHQQGEPWPIPRFAAGTYIVTDILTGLIWQKSDVDGDKNWNEAIDDCYILSIEEPAGIFTITYDDWRLPNRFELESLLDMSQIGNALPSGHPFIGLQPDYYWTGTTYKHDTGDAWRVYIWDGSVNYEDKSLFNSVWCVHDGI